ncbi:MAG: pyridoxal-phosphate dependent enzyme [Sphingobacteriales bacterium]|nr:pyridoxal-phosphate dependent enzyme [Sphingobacteriales bacterium]
MEDIQLKNISIDRVTPPLFDGKDIIVDVLRCDKIHPVISGNKWFKLRYYLEEAKSLGKKRIVTFGGAWSNHIVATAAACKLYGFRSTGIIRGEEPANYSATLNDARVLGMKLVFISRQDYQHKSIPDNIVTDDCYVINEGGYGIKGAEGAAGMLGFCDPENYTHICCACGTGTMAAGIVRAGGKRKIIAISVLKNNFGAEQSIRNLLPDVKGDFSVAHDYHFGGYAKLTSTLINFMNEFYRLTSIPTDFVYTGKLFYGIHDLARQNHFPAGSRVLVIHCGGLQGNASLNKGTLIF